MTVSADIKPATRYDWSQSPLGSASARAFYVGLGVVVAAVVSGICTYLILTGLTPIVPTHGVVISVLLINVVLVLAMLGIVMWQLAGLWLARKREAAGARLHFKIVSLFSVIAMLPAVILAIFASISLDRGLDHWFSSRTQLIVRNSLEVAQAYLQEHGQVIATDIVAMAKDIEDAADLLKTRPNRFQGILFSQTALRGLQAAYLIKPDGTATVTALGPGTEFAYTRPHPRFLQEADGGETVVVPPLQTNLVGAILKLKRLPDTFLYVVRAVNPKVVRQLKETGEGVAEFNELQDRRAGVQIAFGLMYVAVALTLLLAAIWIGMWFANMLVAPIRRLITASNRVSGGDFTTRVPVRVGEGDLGHLSITFNRMTSELKNQRDELIATNDQLLERRRFMEAVLSGVSAGVIGIDPQGIITIANPSAQSLLGLARDELMGRELADIVPEFSELVVAARAQTRRENTVGNVSLEVDGRERKLAVQVTREHAGPQKDYGAVVTFDDITELVTAQRTSAWADVARRIAHEIKNPLTPIQLSAERIQRKYGKVITEDKEVFDRCTDTIIRQVSDIGRMVDEFSAFARMPAPVMQNQDVRDVTREAVYLFSNGNTAIDFEMEIPDQPAELMCDRGLLAQALTNMIKNATEAIGSYAESGRAPENYRGRIMTRVTATPKVIEITVVDNGCGLPAKDRERLVEPYMTTREKGTGIGLAVVHRVVEQHGGTLRLEDAPADEQGHRGAAVRIVLPRSRTVQLPSETDGKQSKAASGHHSAAAARHSQDGRAA